MNCGQKKARQGAALKFHQRRMEECVLIRLNQHINSF
jgi:hypothetical protein